MTSHSRRFSAKFGALLTGAAVALFAAAPMTGSAVIHEIVAAYCSGGGKGIITEAGELEPRPLTLFGTQTFARPVIASGAVVDGAPPTVSSKPNTKFPEGTSVFDATASNSDHPSAAHCVGAADLP